jgi:nitric oxide reductase subunit B
MSFRKLWIGFAAVIIISFAVLGWTGIRIYQQAPPVPERVVASDGAEVVGPGTIHAGQNVWQSIGGMEIGSVWGHGSYVAPDWAADWLHREAQFILNAWAAPASFASLSPERQAELESRLEQLLRRNTYDASTETVTVDPVRAQAFAANLAYYTDVFSNGREEFAIPAGALTDPTHATGMRGVRSFCRRASSRRSDGCG